MYNIEEINQLDQNQFLVQFGNVFEHSPWIAELTYLSKPFTSLNQLHQAMVGVVEVSSYEKKLALIHAHPNLGERISMTADSTKEQLGAGLQDLTAEEYENFLTLNKQYIDKFGFPFILAVKGKNKQQIYQSMETRVHHSVKEEFQTALSEIYKIAILRLEEKIGQ